MMSETTEWPNGIVDAIAQAGTQASLATTLGVTQQAISKWVQQGWVPLRRAKQIEEKFKIPRSRLANPQLVTLLTQ